MTNDVNELGLMIRAARARKGLTIRALAALSGLDKKAINRIETGDTKRPQGPTLAAIAPHLDLQLEDLLRAVPPLEAVGQ